jgi:ribosomal protein S21
MANVTNVRVELKPTRGSSDYDRDRAFKIMLALFKRKVADSGVLSTYKDHESYVSPTRKARLKLRAVVQARKLDDIEGKLRRGEAIEKDKNLVKKVQTRMKKKKQRKDKQRDGGGGYNFNYREYADS